MDNRLIILDYHDCLHGFVAGYGTGTATTEMKLEQQLTYIEQVPLCGVFIKFRRAYGAMYRGSCLKILKPYGVGPKMLKLIVFFANRNVLVCQDGDCYSRPLRARQGVTEGGLFSARIFNTMIDAIVRVWM